MNIFARPTARHAQSASQDVIDSLGRQIALLRKEIAGLSLNVGDYGENAFTDVQRNAVALARDIGKSVQPFARQASRQASSAGKAVQQNPVPVLVALGTLALLSTLIFSRD